MASKVKSAIKVILLFGPTAVGKTETLRLFSGWPVEIISADSMQVYRRMDVGTAKPDIASRKRIPHHMIDICEPNRQFGVGDFVTGADELVREITGRGRRPVVSGGTAFYLKHFLYGLPGTPPGNPTVRSALREELRVRGVRALFEALNEIDGEYARRISPNDPVRIMRALEVYRLSGRRLSSYSLSESPRKDYRFLMIGLRRETAELQRRINERVEKMFAMGLPGEIKALLAGGFGWDDPGMKGIGYREFRSMALGCFTLEHVKQRIMSDTRRYAKRQYTFFRSLPGVKWYHPEDTDGIREVVSAFSGLPRDPA